MTRFGTAQSAGERFAAVQAGAVRLGAALAAAALLTVGTTADAQQATAPNTLTAAEQQAGWKLLFDGKTTKGWRNYKADTIGSGWQVVDGALTRVGRGGDIISNEKFGDFELILEWKLSPQGPPGNSGIFYRVVEDTAAIYWNAPEMQILDDARHSDGRTLLTSTGANYAIDPATPGLANPIGEWNTVRILVVGNHVEHWLNGKKSVEYELGSADWKAKVAKSKFAPHPLYGKAREGYIGLQEHGSFVAFRNIKIRPVMLAR